MTKETKIIKLDYETYDKLKAMKRGGESFNHLLKHLLDMEIFHIDENGKITEY